MASEALAHGSTHTGAHSTVSAITRDAGQWMAARAADGLEATFSVEVDERYWRVRRSHGATSSMFEARLHGALSAGDVTAAIARWAVGAGLSVRSSHEDGVFRVTLSRGD
jgi:hypothetical protein